MTRTAKEPFEFVTASYLVRIRPERAGNLDELTRGLQATSEASIFHHTFQSLERHHYTPFSSDFAQWVLTACNDPQLAEKLAAVDVRDCVSLDALRKTLAQIVDDHLKRRPDSSRRPAFDPFYFCEAVEVTVHRDERAQTLWGLAEGIRGINLETLHYHFISSRLRLHLRTNDFSHWIEQNLEFPELARSLNRIDFYTNTLESLRAEILETLEPWMDQ